MSRTLSTEFGVASQCFVPSRSERGFSAHWWCYEEIRLPRSCSLRGPRNLQHVDDRSGKEVRDDIIDGLEVPVKTGSSGEGINLIGVVEHIDLRLQ